VGAYAAAARRNEVASEADLDFIEACGIQGFYPALYTSHNMHFAAVAHTMQGRYAPARRYAERLVAHVRPMADQVPELEAFLPTLEQVLVAFQKWDDILALPKPAEKFHLHQGIWHFARGMAFAAQRQNEAAEEELKALRQVTQGLAAGAVFGPFNKAADIFTICEKQIGARLALNEGNTDKAAKLLTEALPIEDGLRYMEPPDWYLFTREALGGVLLTAGKFSEAEAVFRKDLDQHRRNGRSLFGLQASLEKQGKTQAARLIGRGLENAWENADSPLEGATIWWVAAK
jgi:tetratricopeptide (TPR) repeat protein